MVSKRFFVSGTLISTGQITSVACNQVHLFSIATFHSNFEIERKWKDGLLYKCHVLLLCYLLEAHL
jgi:hypothetical protein